MTTRDETAARPDPGAEAAIRDLLRQEAERPDPAGPVQVAGAATAVPVPVAREAEPASEPVSEPPPAPRHAAFTPLEEVEEVASARGVLSRSAGRMGQAARALLARPDAPRWIAAALLLAAFLWKPLVLLMMALVAVLALVVAWNMLGPARVDEMVGRWYGRLHARDPETAERLRARAIKSVGWLSVLVDRLPERWTVGLYLPDFEPRADMPEKMRVDPFDKLRADLGRGAEGSGAG